MENADLKNGAVPKESCTQSVDIDGREYVYFMADNFADVVKRLEEMGCRAPRPQDWRWNPDLHQNVRDKMAELGMRYSLTMSHDASVLNSYVPNSAPHIVFLSELRKWQQEAQELLNVSLNINIPNMPPLLYACAVGSVSAVRLLLEHNVDVNARGENGWTALMFASARNRPEIVRLLLQNGADISLRANNGYNAVLYAILSEAKKAVKVLEGAGAEPVPFPLLPAVDKRKVPFNEKLAYYVLNNIGYMCGKKKNFAWIYKRAGISRQLFSKIWSSKDPAYRPKKHIVLQLAIGLQLTIAQTEDLLESAGYFLLSDDAFDSIVAGFISRLDYDIHKIDGKLFEETGRTLSSYE
ncbi:MAG: ankyrin repeat domain-containing protein [Treponemataceae bacterium]|nr:ankyrin repeat domain-containing protein [Treponemataceae bacterium]